MRYLVTGATGMLGTDSSDALEAAGHDVIRAGRDLLDVTDRKAVMELVTSDQPDVIVNCAAFTRVDDCEAELEQAIAVNGTAVSHLAGAADAVDALLVQISTDFVFAGTDNRPYEVDAPTAPLSAYGKSKLAGEEAAGRAKKHLIIRTSWLFGWHGWNFVEAIRRQIGLGKEELRVVNDQRGKPTFTPNLADAILELSRIASSDQSARGIVHYADSPECTWFDFARRIVDLLERQDALNQPVAVVPVSTAEFPRPARRPAYSVLSTRRYQEITGNAPASWEDGLERYLAG